MQIWNWIRWWGWQQTTAWPCNVCDNDILKLLKSWFYFGKIWTYELKFLLCWASDWQIKEGKYIANMLWIVTMSISIGLYPILDLWMANKLHYITLQEYSHNAHRQSLNQYNTSIKILWYSTYFTTH